MLSASFVTIKRCGFLRIGFASLAALLSVIGRSQAPTISSFSPTSGGSNTSVTITGTNLQNTTAVKFGGVPAIFFLPINSTTLLAYVGNGASGSITVTTSAGTTSMAGFTFLYPPQIDSISPVMAGYGDTVAIQGIRFIGAQQVYFGSVPAESFFVISDNLIKARVANGASGTVSVYVAASGYGNLSGFMHTGPVINNMTPSAGPSGTAVTLYGKNFLNTTAVTIGGLPATSFNIISADTLSLVTPTGAVDTIKVTTPRVALLFPISIKPASPR